MKNIIFDFDSTLIRKESLELILEPLLKGSLDKLHKIEQITDQGMQGNISFKDSLERRLAIASPTKQSIQDFVNSACPSLLTEGIKNLIDELQRQAYNIWIFSGGLAESIKPFADYLSIPKQNIYAVEVTWNEDGSFNSLDNSNGACDSKLSAFELVKTSLKGQVIAVGDGYTDYQLYEHGVVDKFIAYIEHVARDNVIKVSDNIARNVPELRDLIF